jgi:hypothetical protein
VIHEDVIVYLHPNRKDYVALIGDEWKRWPAVEAGWLSRQGCPPSTVDDCYELEPRLGALALKLSGVTP